jgi:hypothetical protein
VQVGHRKNAITEQARTQFVNKRGRKKSDEAT